MKYKSFLSVFLLWTVSWAGTAMADATVRFTSLSDPNSAVGQISGTVKSCSYGFDLSGTLVHIPGISASTKLGSKHDFKLLSVPEGDYQLVFERNGRVMNSVPVVTVRDKMMTSLENVTLCPDSDGDGYNLLSDLDDSNPAIYPGAKEICDRIDNNGNGKIDEGCSYRKCPKGGNFCLSNWNNSNRIIHNNSKPALPPAKTEETPDTVAESRIR
jgi:putative metal-binding protein